jgi:thymidylate synthase ThyX
MPHAVGDAGMGEVYHASMVRSASLYEALWERFGTSQASYAVALAYRVRYAMQFNAREAMHMLELRTGPQGHPEYRNVCLQMYRAIAEGAGHRALAGLMVFVDVRDHDAGGLERLESERRAEFRRQAP